MLRLHFSKSETCRNISGELDWIDLFICCSIIFTPLSRYNYINMATWRLIANYSNNWLPRTIHTQLNQQIGKIFNSFIFLFKRKYLDLLRSRIEILQLLIILINKLVY